MNQGAMPAYPCSPKLEREICANNDGYGSIGLTKREVFAMAAMQGMSTQLHPQAIIEIADGIRGGATIAKASVIMADALLAALSDQPTRQEE